jgi:Ni2+-binding GTPase involved in maturation of urease and hydrogenase
MSTPRTRYIMLGGFLGAGKTTAMLRLAEYLTAHNLRAGLITNDQSTDLVDTARARTSGNPVEEVTGGCFCCRFDTLMQAAQQLTCNQPLDVLLAEPVGSCTDIRATVAHPLQQLFGDEYIVAPLSVLVDPHRSAEALANTSALTEKVNYIYRKQLEEADLVVVNKIDIVTPEFRRSLRETLGAEFPHAQVLEVSCQTGEGLEAWFDLLLSASVTPRAGMQVDYDTYAEGEALLGWLNARVALTAYPAISANTILLDLLGRLKTELANRGIEIAHCKASIETGEPADFASASLTSTAGQPALTWPSATSLTAAQLTLNLRAEAAPDLLRNTVLTTLYTLPNIHPQVEELSAFQPGRPPPTHRYATVAG